MVRAKKAAAGGKRIIDVAHPGESAPSATSKPVIMPHRMILQDPMFTGASPNDGNQSAETTENIPIAKTSTKPRLMPLSAPELEETAQDEAGAPTGETVGDASDAPSADDETKPEQPVSDSSKAETSAPVPAEAAKPGAVETSAEPAESPTQAEPKPKAVDEAAETAKQAERDAALQKLADSKQYLLPINTVEKRRTKRVVILGIVVSVVLLVAWADIALDAGLIQIQGIKPVTHFFSS